MAEDVTINGWGAGTHDLLYRTASYYIETASALYLTESWNELTLTQSSDGDPNLNAKP